MGSPPTGRPPRRPGRRHGRPPPQRGRASCALDALGISWAAASTDYGLLERLPLSLNLLDLTHAASVRWAVTRALRTVAARALIYAAAGATLLEPAARLRRAAVRFDALAADNRRGRRHVLQRTLERRSLSRAHLLLPFGAPITWPAAARQTGRPIVALPTPVEGHPAAPERAPTVVCYAGAPDKKRLDLLIAAWAAAGPPSGHDLLVTGIDRQRGQHFLRRHGIPEPPRVTWCGALEQETYRRLTSRAVAYLAASRFEDYGIAQLEALADGALLVTVASEGPFEALQLARRLNPALVADKPSAAGLARSLRHALSLDAEQCRSYRARARSLLEPYSRDAFRRRLRDEVLPLLLEGASELR